MKPTIFIPKTIKAGFRNRSDTFTGKLAYVIYYDEKGTLRKEKSWNSWRQKDIASQDFQNKPTKGFYVNRSTGGHKSGWNYRKSYIRIYDPRGFEFEISIENLMYIMEHVGTSPEKGIEGEFIYGWDKTELVLIPTNSPDYKEIKEYNEILQNKNNKLRVRDLTVGGTYKHKNNNDYVYVGRRELWELNHRWRDKRSDNYGEKTISKGKYHTFVYLNKEGIKRYERVYNVVTVKSPSGVFIQEVSSNKSEDFKQIMDYVNDHFYFNPVDKSAQKTIRLEKEDLLENLGGGRMVLIDDEWYLFRESYAEDNIYQISKKIVNNNVSRYDIDRTRRNVIGKGTIEELLDKFKMYDIKHYLTNGKELKY